MRIIQLAVLVGVAALLLRVDGFADRASTAVRDLEQHLTQLAGPAGSKPTGRATTSDFRDSDVNIRSAPSTASPVLGVGGVGDEVSIDRSLTGETVTCQDGHSTADWAHIRDGRIVGFVSRCYL
jgi:hypothetical protein